MASFPLKKRTFSYPRLFNHKIWKLFPLHCIPEIMYAESIDTVLIIHAKSFPLWPNAYQQYIRYGQTYGQTDGETDDNGIIDAYSIAVIKKACQKLCTV